MTSSTGVEVACGGLKAGMKSVHILHMCRHLAAMQESRT